MLAVLADMNECTSGTDDCSMQASCRNTQGSYECTCNDGYSGPGNACEGMASVFALITVTIAANFNGSESFTAFRQQRCCYEQLISLIGISARKWLNKRRY